MPANKRVVITVINNDITPEEFESNELRVEKVIAGNSKGTVRIGPLKPGRYPFVGEFHEATAKGPWSSRNRKSCSAHSSSFFVKSSRPA